MILKCVAYSVVLSIDDGDCSACGASEVLVHGHRGARAVLPENTIPAFEYAIEAGVDVLELDLAVTKDNVVVVSHDPHDESGHLHGAPAKRRRFAN